MTPQEHIQAAIEHLEIACADLRAAHEPDGYGSKPRELRFALNALDALAQAFAKK